MKRAKRNEDYQPHLQIFVEAADVNRPLQTTRANRTVGSGHAPKKTQCPRLGRGGGFVWSSSSKPNCGDHRRRVPRMAIAGFVGVRSAIELGRLRAAWDVVVALEEECTEEERRLLHVSS